MDRKARGQHAQRLLDDDVLQEAINGVLSYHQSVFMNPTATDEQVLAARDEVKALKSVMGRLRSFVADGKILEKKDQDRDND